MCRAAITMISARAKCAECDHRRFLPVTDDIIRWHLSGHDDAGHVGMFL
jgi:hypothetical protein